MRLDATAKGVFPIAPTPFFKDGGIDWASIDRLCDFYGSVGSTGLTVLGVMGEAPKLDGEESLAVATRFIRRAAGLPVVVGVSAPGFAAMRTLARAAMQAGAAGVMIAPPNHLRTDDQIVTYYAQAAEAIGRDVPFVLQDFPLNFTVVMTPGVIRRIVADNPGCVMLKHEDWPGLDKISGYAFPDMLVDVVAMSAAGDRDAAHDLFDAHLPLIRYEQQPGIGLAVRKYVMARRGLIASDAQRSPGATLDATAKAEVEFLLGRVARIDPRAALGATAALVSP